MPDNTEHLEPERKRLMWRAMHRGIKEMDIIIGGFAKANVAGLNEIELVEFERLLDIPDQDFLAWITGQEAVPSDVDSKLLQRMLAYRP
jgi:antitoxin CptB